MAEPRAAKGAAKREPKPTRSFTLTAGWAALLLALLTVVFFHEVAVGGKTFVTPDATMPAGFVRIGEHSLWQEHVYPLWNPYVFLGMPSFGSGAYNPLIYPPDWPVGLLQRVLPLPLMTWMLLYYFLGGFFLFLMAREWDARPEAAVLGAIAFAFTPNLVAVGAFGHGSQLVDSAYIPLMVWLAARWLKRGALSDLGWLALAGGFQFLRGHVQICVYTWMAVGLYAAVELLAAVRTPSRLGPVALRAVALGAAAALAFGIAGFYNLPLKDYARYSIRGSGDAAGGVGKAYATQWSMGPWELPAMVIPNAVGFGGQTYWGAMPFTDYPNAFVGVVVALLALLAFSRPSGAAKAFALVLAVFSVLVSFGSHAPFYGFLYDHFPQFNKFRVPVMIIVLFQLAAAAGAAWGWSAVLEARGGKSGGVLEKLLLVAGAALVLLGGAGLVGRDALHGAYLTAIQAHHPGFPPQAAEAAFGAFLADLPLVALAGLAVVAAAWLTLRGKIGAGAGSVIVLVVLLLSLWPVSGRVMQPAIGSPVEASLDYGRDDVVQWLLEHGGPQDSYRVLAPAEFQSNRFAGFGIGELGGSHAAKPRLFQDLMDKQATANPRWWALLGVRYVVLPQPLDSGHVPPDWRQAFLGSAVIYELRTALPRATVVGAYGVAPDTGRAAIDSVSAGTRDAAGFTWIAGDPQLTLGPVDGATATITHSALHEVDVDVRTPGPALLRLADLWYPDWTVSVDGRPATMLRADHLLRAVAVTAGEHRVAFRFRSPSVRRGLLVSFASLLVVLALLAAGILQRRRRPAGA